MPGVRCSFVSMLRASLVKFGLLALYLLTRPVIHRREFCVKVLPDLLTNRALAAADGSAAVDAVNQAQNAAIRIWSGRGPRRPGRGRKINMAKTYRRKTYAFGVALDHTCRMTIGKGLESLDVPEDTRRSGEGCETWSAAHMVSDKGPDCVCFANFVRWHLRLNVEWHFDASHGGAGSCRDACARAGLACHSFLAYLAYNAGYGEWKDGARAEQVRASISAATAVNSSSSDAAFQFVQARFGSVCRSVDEEAVLYERLRADGGAWKHDLPRVSLSKYFVLRSRFVEHERGAWLDRAYGWLVVGAELGLLASAGGCDAVVAEVGQPATFAAGKKAALQWKKGKKGLVRTAMLFFLDPDSLTREEIIATFTGPLHRWHGQHQRARSAEETWRWALQQCDGEYYVHIRETLRLVHDRTILQPCGLSDSDPSAGRAADDCQCVFQNGLAQQCGMMAVGMALSRLLWGMDYLDGFPKRAILFSPEETATSKVEVLREFESHASIVDRAASADMPQVLQDWAAKSHMLWTPVLHIRHYLSAAAGNLTPEFMDFNRKRSHTFRFTQMIEEGNKYQIARVRKAPNKRARGLATLEALIESPALHTTHKFHIVDTSSVALPRSAELAADAFRPDFKKGWDKLRTIMGKSETSPWFSPGANNQNCTIGHIMAMQELLGSHPFPQPSDLRKLLLLNALFHGQSIIVSRAHGPWYYALGDLAEACAIGWPMVRRQYSASNTTYFEFDTSNQAKWQPLVMVRQDEWRFCEVAFRSPEWQALTFPGDPEVRGGRNVVRLLQTSDPSLPIVLAARRGFWSLSRTWIIAYCKEYDIEVDDQGSLFDVVWDAARRILGTDDPDTLLALCSARTQVPLQEALAPFDEVENYSHDLDADTKKEFEKERKRFSATRVELQEFDKCYSSKVKDIAAKRAQATVAATKAAKGARLRFGQASRGKGRGADPSYEEKRSANIERFLAGDEVLEQSYLAQLCPLGGSVWNNWKNAAWCGHYKGQKRFKRDWADGGRTEAGFALLKELWKQHCAGTGVQLSACPVEGLFNEAEVA